MNSALQKFQHQEFGSIRAIEINGEPWFVGKDIADALGYTNSRKALSDHVDGDDVTNRYPIRDAMGREQKTTLINESGLYSLILSSKLATAKKFRRWVTSEILPSIRKHGAYITDDMLDNLVRDPNLAYELFKKLQSERGKTAVLLEKVEELAPKARYCDIILQTRNALPITLIAKDYGRSAVSFNRLLHDLGIQHRVGNAWVPYQKYTGKGYTVSRTYYTASGLAVMHTCWTQKGRLFLYNTLAHYGILPSIEVADAFSY